MISLLITFSVYIIYIISIPLYIHNVWLYSLGFKSSDDIKENPDPKANSCGSLYICHWNLNSASAYNFIKLSVLCVYIYKCLLETYLDSSISSDDDNLELPEYNLVHADNRTNTKKGSACIIPYL